MSQKAPAKGSGSGEMLETLEMPPKYPVFQSNISAGQQKTLKAFESQVANAEKLSQVRGKGSKIGRKRKKRRKGGRKERQKGQQVETVTGTLVIFFHPPLAGISSGQSIVVTYFSFQCRGHMLNGF